MARRTADLRAAIDRSRALQAKAELANRALKANQAELGRRRQALAKLERTTGAVLTVDGGNGAAMVR